MRFPASMDDFIFYGMLLCFITFWTFVFDKARERKRAIKHAEQERIYRIALYSLRDYWEGRR